MPRKIVETDDWPARLELLHWELGARRPDLYRDLGVELRALLGITPAMRDQGEDVYGRVASWLEGMISNFQPKLGTPETVFLSLRVSSNVEIKDTRFCAIDALERTSVDKLGLGQRQKRLANDRHRSYRVGESTSRAYVAQFHEEFDPKIKAELEAKDIIPCDDTTPVPAEDTRPTEQAKQSDAPASAESSAPSETSTEPDASETLPPTPAVQPKAPPILEGEQPTEPRAYLSQDSMWTLPSPPLINLPSTSLSEFAIWGSIRLPEATNVQPPAIVEQAPADIAEQAQKMAEARLEADRIAAEQRAAREAAAADKANRTGWSSQGR